MNDYYGEDDLVTNTSSRIAVCLCVDTSASMNDYVDGAYTRTGKIVFIDGQERELVEGGNDLLGKMNDGINKFYDAIRRNDQASASCEIAIVTFDDSAKCIEDFSTIDKKSNVNFTETGDNTNMSEGVKLALDKLDARKKMYKENGVDYFQPWLVIFTDGKPSEGNDVSAIQSETRRRSANKKLSVFTFALTPETDIEVLSGFSKRKPIPIKNDKLDEFFEWLGKSVSDVSESQVGDKIKLDTSDMDVWAEL